MTIQSGCSELLCLDFNWESEFLVLLGGSEGLLYLYDIRNPLEYLYEFQGDSNNKYIRADWSPNNKEIFFAGGENSVIEFFDCTKLENNNGIFFKHFHNEHGVNDINWNP